MNQLSVPGSIYWKKREEFAKESLSLLKGKRVLLVMSVSSAKRLSLGKWIDELSKDNLLVWINSISSNPTDVDVFKALKIQINELPDVVIAIGGGSAIDMAKSWVALSYLKRKAELDHTDVLNSIKTKEYLNYTTSIPIYAVPTTAGTGSEVTRWATVWNIEGQTKYSIEAPWLCPKYAYIIPEYTKSMPKRLTLSTGLDALCHAIEAYWAKSSNVMIREISKMSIRLIVEYLPKVLSDGDNLFYREKVCLGSLFSGLAFSNTRTTACHSISYPLTMRFGVEHGLACALSLAKVMEINLPMIIEADELMKALEVTSSEELQTWLDDLSNEIVKLRLSTFGICKKDIPNLVNLSFTQGRMDNNPVEISSDDVRELLYSLL
jgi:alcohol dehydrogenase class IV